MIYTDRAEVWEWAKANSPELAAFLTLAGRVFGKGSFTVELEVDDEVPD